MEPTRRTLLRSMGVSGVLGLAGCSGGAESDDGSRATSAGDTRTDGGRPTETDAPRPPTAESSLHLSYDVETLADSIVSGGVPKDGIPSIDDPRFSATEPDQLDPGDPVFGVVRDDEAKAYPQYILVNHEIVNDTLGGDPVAVTYCPLTGTVQGFEREPVEFGVSGRLLNSNLVMYDRGTDSWWPQVLATAVRGEMTGSVLREFRVVWTTWERWSAAHPNTLILTEETGFSRRYGSDPYGRYNPKQGYYASQSTMFEPLQDDDRAHSKAVVIGTRTTAGALAFDKETLLDRRVLTGRIDGTTYVAVADADLATGYVYANPEDATVKAADRGYAVDGETFSPDDLPLERSLAFDSMWFAWAGFYPESGYVD